MPAIKKVKRTVAHPKFHMMVDGKLQHVPAGTVVSVPEDLVETYGEKLADPKKFKALEAGKLVNANAGTSSPEVQAALTEMQNQVADAIKAKNDAEARAEKAEAELATLNASAAKKAKSK